MKKMDVLGISLTDYTLREALKLTNEYMNNGALNTVFYISTEILVEAGESPEQKNWLESMDMVVVGETDILRASDNASRNRVHETENNDYIREFLHRLVRGQKTVFLLADNAEGVKKLQNGLLEREPDLQIIGSYSLSEVSGDLDFLINEINDAAPSTIISCLPYPLQPKLIHEQKMRMNAEIWVALLKDWNKNLKKPPFLMRISNNMYRQIFRRRMKNYQTEKAE